MLFSTIKEPQSYLLTLIQHHRATWEVLEGTLVCWAWPFIWLFLQVTEQISVNTEIWTHEPQPIAHGFKCFLPLKWGAKSLLKFSNLKNIHSSEMFFTSLLSIWIIALDTNSMMNGMRTCSPFLYCQTQRNVSGHFFFMGLKDNYFK